MTFTFMHQDISVKDISPATDYELRVLRAIRRIFRVVDSQSKALKMSKQITTSQLVMLMALCRNGPLTLTALNQMFDLGARTALEIIDELETKGFVRHMHGHEQQSYDRIVVTGSGEQLVHEAPVPLQCRLLEGLRRLPEEEQSIIAYELERLARLLGAGDMDASAVLTPEPISRPTHHIKR